MKSPLFSRSSTAALALFLSLATAHPLERTESNRCAADSTRVSTTVTCGQRTAVQDCVLSYGSNLDILQQCLEEAGCATSETKAEASLVVEQCAGRTIEVVELRQVDDLFARQTTTSAESTSTATSTDTSTTASTTSTSASATSTGSSTTASSTSSSTASTTSSTSSSTSTSTSNSTPSGMRTISWVVAAILIVFTVACVGGVCFSCCSDRKTKKKEQATADAKEALLGSQH